MKKPTSKFKYAFALISSFLFISSSAYGAEKGSFHSRELLEKSPDAQFSFFAMSMNMAAVIALRARPDIAKCISVWYPADEKTREERHSEMIGYMKKYPNSHPSAIVLAAVEKHCGRYDGKKPS